MSVRKACDMAAPVIHRAEPWARAKSHRRRFIRDLAVGATALTCADFLRYFQAHGMPPEGRGDTISNNKHFTLQLVQSVLHRPCKPLV